jgi:hypothetical protein
MGFDLDDAIVVIKIDVTEFGMGRVVTEDRRWEMGSETTRGREYRNWLLGGF